MKIEIEFDEFDKMMLLTLIEDYLDLAQSHEQVDDADYVRWWAKSNGLISEQESEKIFIASSKAERRIKEKKAETAESDNSIFYKMNRDEEGCA